MNKVKNRFGLTSVGKWIFFLAIFLLFAAQNTGNNLLYLVCSCAFAVLFVGLLNLFLLQHGFKAVISFPQTVSVGKSFEIVCRLYGNSYAAKGFYEARFENGYTRKNSKNADFFLKTEILLEKSGKYIFKGFSVFRLGLLGIFYLQSQFDDFVIYALEDFGGNCGALLYGQGNNGIIGNGREGDFWGQELYREGEDSSRINWSVSARSQEDWIVIRSKSQEELKMEKALLKGGDKAGSDTLPIGTIEIYGKTFNDLRRSMLEKTLSRSAYRIISLIGLLSFFGIYSTGYFKSQIYWVLAMLLGLFFKGRAFSKRYHGLAYFLCFAVTAYIVAKGIVYPDYIKIVLLLEFSVLTLVLQISTMISVRNSYGALNLSLMIILGIAAMNVNFAFPIVFIPFLILNFMILSFLRSNTLLKENVAANHFSISPAGIGRSFFFTIFFMLFWISSFYLIPRTASYGIAANLGENRSEKGFSGSTLSLNNSGLLEDNMTVVMRLIPKDEKSGSPSVLRRIGKKLIRGGSFVKYENGEWKRDRRRFGTISLRDTSGELNVDNSFSEFDKLFNYEVFLEDSEIPLVFLPDGTKRILFNSHFIGVGPEDSLFFMSSGSNFNRNYIVSMLADSTEIVDCNVEDLQRYRYLRRLKPYLSLNGISDKVLRLSYFFASENPSIGKRVNKIMDFLREGYEYSLEQPVVPNNTDPVDYFLFQNKSGTCQHFATAMAVLLRCNGIPCRVTNGYLMGDWNEVGGFFTIRQSHAHAWVEVFFPTVGWVSFDPTPPDRGNESSNFFKQLLDKAVEMYEGFWYNYVYSFDGNSQKFGLTKTPYVWLGRLLNIFASSWFWFLILFMFGMFSVSKNFFRALYLYWVRKNRWVPFCYVFWESGLKVCRRAGETPRDFHGRLARDGIIDKSFRDILFQVEELIDDYAFNPKADKVKACKKISALLKGVHL